jgi:hypothetical protein
MDDEVIDLRKGDRFHAVVPIGGSFSSTDVSLINVSVTGAQVMHSQPIRIGTRSRLTFHHGDVVASVQVQVVWSHLWQTPEGHAYRSGVRLDMPDVQFAAAVNGLLRAGAIQRDTESLERKRQRELEREMRRKSGSKLTPVPPNGV